MEDVEYHHAFLQAIIIGAVSLHDALGEPLDAWGFGTPKLVVTLSSSPLLDDLLVVGVAGLLLHVR